MRRHQFIVNSGSFSSHGLQNMVEPQGVSPLWKCEKCASLGIKNCLLRVCVSLPILSLPSRELIVFVLGEARPIARLVHVAVAWRRAVQEVDPRFSRLAALELANQKAASHLGIEAGALEA